MIVAKGNPLVMGSSKNGKNYNFAFSSEAKQISLLIYDLKYNLKYEILLDSTYKTGNVFACAISDISMEKALYCYEIDGIKMIDPYAKTISGCSKFGISDEEMGTIPHLSRVCLDSFDWGEDVKPNIPYEDCIFYKFHVRGFTKSRTSGVKYKGTFEGILEKLDYLKKLGVTTLELMPAYEYDEIQRFSQLYTQKEAYNAPIINTPVNYWGYNTGFYFAPKASFTSIADIKSDYTIEFKNVIKTLHANHIEVVMEFLFDKEPAHFILDCVRYWVTQYHIDGIHLYASCTALELLSNDPLLADIKIITTYWNGERGCYKHMANYNNGFMETVRKFLKGDENQLGQFAYIARSNPDNSANINYVANHNGFTMMDLVSFDRKHNENNGENNRDGENFNYSWNCGVEGKTRKKRIIELRQRQIKNAFVMLLTSAGTPLILAGDEFENSQSGNNNPYCIDGETSWLNWKSSNEAKDIEKFVTELIQFRKNNKILHMKKQLLAADPISCGYPDISYHGTNAWYQVMENYNRHMGILYCSKYVNLNVFQKENNFEKEDGFEQKMPVEKNNNIEKKAAFELIYVGFNLHWEWHDLALPKLPEGGKWNVEFNTGTEKIEVVENKLIKIPPRTTVVLKTNSLYLKEKEAVRKNKPAKKVRKNKIKKDA